MRKLTRLYFPTLCLMCDRKCIYILFSATATVNDSIQSTLEMLILWVCLRDLVLYCFDLILNVILCCPSHDGLQRCYVDETPFNTTFPSPSCPFPFPLLVEASVVTPLAALAKEDIAAADNGAIPSIPGGGSTFAGTAEPFVEGGNGSPPAVTGNEAAWAPFVVVVDGPSPRSAILSISVDGGTDSDLLVSFNTIPGLATYFAFLLGPGPSAPSSAPNSETVYILASSGFSTGSLQSAEPSFPSSS